jgi:hypothetical protein
LRQSLHTAVVYLTAAVLTLLLVRLLHARGGPYWERPETILDHVGTDTHHSRDAIRLIRRAEMFVPTGTSLTVLVPAQAPHYDYTHHLLASGLLPHHEVRHPSLAAHETRLWPDYLIAIESPLVHPGYRLVMEWPEGRLYQRR